MDRRLTAAEKGGVADEVVDAVAKLTAEHRAAWLLNHVLPDAEVVTRLADTWLAGEVPVPSMAVPGSISPCFRSMRPAARLVLVQATLSGSSGMRVGLANHPAADVAYASGDIEAAFLGYRTRIDANPQDDQAWLGLGLVLAARPGQRENVLVSAPHVALAVRDRILARKPTVLPPTEFAEWLRAAVQLPAEIS